MNLPSSFRRCALVVALLPAAAFAQVQINIGLPSIRFDLPPPVVIVSPGVQVVEDYDDEVFVVDGWYWVRRDDRWYRARDHRGGWVVVERQVVPVRLVDSSPGRYRRYKHAHDASPSHGNDKHHGRGKGKGHKGKGHD